MKFNKTVAEQMKASDHLKNYLAIRNKREKFENLYKSEKLLINLLLINNSIILFPIPSILRQFFDT